MLDTVSNAFNTPDVEQPYASLGVRDDEYARIREILGRRPTSAELAMYSVMWSEHCSYKSSKVHLRKFGALSQETPRGPLLAGIGEQAGVVDIGQGYAVTFKAESHNSPSYIEPYQGAATGIGGIVRDVLAMGARPIAVMDSLRLGPIDAEDTRRILTGAVSGASDYGNKLGLPNIGGEVQFHPSYLGNPLVNALSIGVLRHEDLHRAHATGAGNKVVLYGASTGGDGIGGASVLSSQAFDEQGPQARPNVQAGDPFMEKLIIEATLEIFAEGLISGIQDLGAAGISCGTSELAAAGDGGMHITLDAVPLRDKDLQPEEILMSESQERMMAIVEPGHIDRFMEICAKWGVEAAVIGEVTDGERLIIEWQGETIVDVDARTVAHDGPVYERPYHRPDWLDDVNANRAEKLPRDNSAAGLEVALKKVLANGNVADKSWVTQQADRYVRGNTVLAHPDNAGMVRIDEDTHLGIALSLDANSRFTFLNPYLGAQLSLSEAYRNVAVTGAEPVAITDCLNFGSPEDPEVMWTFVEAILGLVDGCGELGTPVTGGNVSLYNQTGTSAILPTPTIGMLGVIDDVRTRIKSAFQHPGDAILLLGETAEELSGSIWEAEVHDGHLGGMPPAVRLGREKALAAVFGVAAKEGLLSSSHDLSEGGLAVALAESAFHNDLGFAVTLPGEDPTVELFSESSARAIVSLGGTQVARFEALCAEHSVPVTRIGEVTGGDQLEFVGRFSVGLDDARTIWQRPIPDAMG
ncbi:MAG: phosphoribosylformylglycinamidine synthase subunit PurL [Propionibacterium sp.]|nr:phosphoribosylformylglycinamidine synthase subunit PurL [Propionibacterium sp.]